MFKWCERRVRVGVVGGIVVGGGVDVGVGVGLRLMVMMMVGRVGVVKLGFWRVPEQCSKEVKNGEGCGWRW